MLILLVAAPVVLILLVLAHVVLILLVLAHVVLLLLVVVLLILLAKLHGADATCPVSTAIFLRIVAEAAWDEIESGVPVSEVAPFWRVVDPKSPLAKKLRSGGAWIEQQRAAERGA